MAGMVADSVHGTAATTTLYVHPTLSAPLLTLFGKARREALVAHARGLTSFVYQLVVGGKGRDGERRGYCLKRVVEEEEVQPHSVRREMLCYRMINELASADDVAIITLLAAFRDESDPFSVSVDLVMPFHPCTLEDLMDEPLMQASVGEDTGGAALQRPALSLAQHIHIHSLFSSFVTSATRQLFSALAFLHSSRIAHRDIKPSNILVDSETLSILLIDFGTCYLESFAGGDDGKGGMTSEVGTGAYRAPESLFSPINGYQPHKLDIWQAGATLVQFFLPLRQVGITKPRASRRMAAAAASSDSDQLGDEGGDDRPEWEKALWADDAGLSWSKLEEVWNSDSSKVAPTGRDGDGGEEEVGEESGSGWKRETLFDASKGDIGLANSIFTLRGLPDSTLDWPEAQHFQPSLARMPFPRRPASSSGLPGRMPATTATMFAPIIQVLERCLQLSSSKRVEADKALEQLKESV